MKDYIKAKILLFVSVSISLFCISCEKGNRDDDESFTDIKSFSGAITIMQDSLTFDDYLDLSFDEKSTTKGTFFRKSNGNVGLFTGVKSGNVLSVNGSIKDNPSLTFSGKIQFDNNKVKLEINGKDNAGNYTTNGELYQQQSINLEGTYYSQESLEYTISVMGQNTKETQSGDGTVTFNQSGNEISYLVPGVNINRTGTLIGNKLILSGKFVIPASTDLVLSENTFKAEVVIIDKYHFEYTGSGKAKGTYQGIAFTISGSSSGEFDRRFKVAVAFLKGGPPNNILSKSSWNAGDELGLLSAQAEAADKKNVITTGIGSSLSPSQVSLVNSWYRGLNKNSSPPRLILVGHSLGGNAVTNSSITDVYYRIAIDPWTATGLPALNQRGLTLARTSTGGGFKNILASGVESIPGYEGPYGLLGYRVANLGSNEWVELNPPTNHFSVVHRVWEKGYVKNEVINALALYKGEDYAQSTLGRVYGYPEILKGSKPLMFCLGGAGLPLD